MEKHFDLPVSFQNRYTPFFIRREDNNILVLSDIHVPYHSNEAIKTAFLYGIKNKVNTILLNGDILDFYKLSRFTTDPLKIDFANEILLGRQFFMSLRKTFPKCSIYYKIGNHEERLEAYLKMKAPELWGVPTFDYENMLDLKKYNIELIKDKRIVYAGKLPILHGHEIRLGAGTVSPARSLYLKVKCSAVTSHLHQASQQTETRLDGKVMSTWSTGCLCELNPEYAPINKWNHGFMHIIIDKRGDYNVENYKIIKGKIFNS